MTIEFEPSEEASALATTVRSICEKHRDTIAAESPPQGLWGDLAEMGVLGLGSPEIGGGPLELVAAHRELGRAGCSGPFVGAAVGSVVLPEELRTQIASGSAIASVSDGGPIVPWGSLAPVIIELDGDRAWLSAVVGEPHALETLAGEPWARVALGRGTELPRGPVGAERNNLVIAAYLVGAGQGVLELAADYARERRQFGRPIGDNQAIAHRLADSHLQLQAAGNLVWMAAARQDREAAGAATITAAARLSALDAALGAAYAGLQTVGALGLTQEFPMGTRSRRIRQVGSLPPRRDLLADSLLDEMVQDRVA